MTTVWVIAHDFCANRVGTLTSQAWPDPRVNGGSGKLRILKLCQVLWLGWGWNGAERYMESVYH